MQIKELSASNLFIEWASSEGPSFVTEEFMNKLVLAVATLALSASAASAQALYPDYGYAPYGYGYAATAPLYDYAAPGYGYAAPAVAPAQGATTIVIVTPAPAYTAPTVASRPLYSYAPGYWGGYGWGGYGRWRAGYGWR